MRPDNDLLRESEAQIAATEQEGAAGRIVFWFAVWAIGMWLGIMAMHIE